jgi:hypothetical protein
MTEAEAAVLIINEAREIVQADHGIGPTMVTFPAGMPYSNFCQGCQMVYFQTKNTNLGKLRNIL